MKPMLNLHFPHDFPSYENFIISYIIANRKKKDFKTLCKVQRTLQNYLRNNDH